MKVYDALKNGTDTLILGGLEDASLEAKILLMNRLKVDTASFILMRLNDIDDKTYKLYMKDIYRRLKREPIAYITGYKEFGPFKFRVNKNTLIPRGDTEIVVREAVKELINYSKEIKNNDEEVNVIDMCTGSGCIAISIAECFPNSKVYGVDISRRALKMSNLNKKLLNVSNVKFVHSNLFKYFKDKKYDDMFDMIISNPPYIKSEICDNLEKEVKDYEPRLALDGGKDGLDFYKRIIKDAKRLLKDNGILVFEIDWTYKEIMEQLLKEEKYKDIKCIKDIENRDRAMLARLDKH